jgi:hypothetical protein
MPYPDGEMVDEGRVLRSAQPSGRMDGMDVGHRHGKGDAGS